MSPRVQRCFLLLWLTFSRDEGHPGDEVTGPFWRQARQNGGGSAASEVSETNLSNFKEKTIPEFHTCVCRGWSFHSVFKEVETRTSAGQVSQVLLVTFLQERGLEGGRKGGDNKHPSSLRTESKKNNKS